MTDYAQIRLRRNLGWPWPEDSWGLDPMYGPDGWCHSCGVPKHEQTGSVILQRKGLTEAKGGWVPNWQFDVYCVDAPTAATAAEKFTLEMLPVRWHGASPGEATQIVARSSERAWFEPEELTKVTSHIRGVAGVTCPDCGVWRWMPIRMEPQHHLRLPPAGISTGIPR